MPEITEIRVEPGTGNLRLQLVERNVYISRMPDGPWLVTVTPGRGYEFASVNEVNDFVTGMACGDLYGVVAGELARLHVLSRAGYSACCHCDGTGRRHGETCDHCNGTCCSYHYKGVDPSCSSCRIA